MTGLMRQLSDEEVKSGLMSVKDTAKYLGVSCSLIYQNYPAWVQKYGLKMRFIGKKKLFVRATVEKLLEALPS